MMANSISTYPDVSLLQWPFNPTSHFVNIAGQNDSTHTSHTALVYEHGALPIPWSYTLVSVFVPWIPAFLGFLRVDKVNTEGKPGFFSRLRKPGIVYNAFHTIAVIILCARARQKRTVPSNLTTEVWRLRSWASLLAGKKHLTCIHSSQSCVQSSCFVLISLKLFLEGPLEPLEICRMLSDMVLSG
jgi:hypothetical protein